MSDEIQRSVGRIEGKVDMLIDMFKDAQDGNIDLVSRVGTLENKQHYQNGFFAAISMVGGVIGAYIQKMFSGG